MYTRIDTFIILVMHRFFRPFTRPIAMLLLAVMVLMPVTEAFSCSLEGESTHSAEVVTDGDQASHTEDSSGKEDTGEASHDVCVHNHCHHTTADLPPQSAVGAFFLKAADPQPIDDANLLANASDGLMRPPRI